MGMDEKRCESLMKSQFLGNIQKIGIDAYVCDNFFTNIERISNLADLEITWGQKYPAVFITRFSNLKQLTKLSVTRGLKCFNEIGQITNLTELDLSFNDIRDSDNIENIAKLRNLAKLNISHNKITNKTVERLSKLVNLTDLNISSNPLGYFPNLSKLKKLKILDISETMITAIDFELPQITNLDISDNRLLSEEDIMTISNMKQLLILKLCNNQFGNTAATLLSKSDSLTYLDISGNFIHDKGIQSISRMEKLTYLDASWNDITDEGAKIICNNMPNLSSIIINENQIESEGWNMLELNRKWKILK